MIIIAGIFKLNNVSDRAEFMSEAAEMVSKSASEVGCRAYKFSEDPVDDTVINVYELWENQESLQNHVKSLHSVEWNQNVFPNYDCEKEILKYRVDKVSEILEWD